MYKNLIFSGGGVRCFAYIGVLKYFEEQDLKYKFSTMCLNGGAPELPPLFLLCSIIC